MTRNEVASIIKDLVGRNWTGIDDTIYNTINSVVELFGSNITQIYDEEIWRHVFTSVDTSQQINAFEIPSNTKYVISGTIIDTTGDEDVYYEMLGTSPIDSFKMDRLDKRNRPSFATGIKSIAGGEVMTFNTFDRGFYNQVGRVDRGGIPKFYWRFGNNVYIYPRNSVNEEGWEFRVLLAKKPPILTTDTDNTITINYPYALAHFAAGILWGTRLGDDARANQQYLLAGQHLTSIATEQEISKLININIRRA